MIKTIYPLKDTTLYALIASMNSGIDEILDIQKEVSASGANNHETSRILLQFDTSTISSSLSGKYATLQFALILYELYKLRSKFSIIFIISLLE